MKKDRPLALAVTILSLFLIILYVISDNDKIKFSQIPTPDLVRRIQVPDLACPIPSLSNRTLPKTALASYPGSGNTWMRHLLQELTGIYTGAIYKNKKLMENGFPGEGRTDGTVVAIKTHASVSTIYKRAILIIRNPYESFLAEFTRQHSGQTGQGNLDHFKGILTGSIYKDKKLMENGFPGEGRKDGTVVAIKTHASVSTIYKRAILIIRNPYGAFLAEFARQHSGHTGQGNLDHFKDWKTYIEMSIGDYRSFFTSWLHHRDVLPVFFDALKSNLTRELNRLSSFLKKAGVEGKPQCALRNSEGNFHRNSTSVSLTFFYNNDQRKTINGLISQIEGMFSKRFVNMTSPMENWKMYITPEKVKNNKS
ncbi:WSC domain-containing protein 2-like [Haliotis rufescens]|uniref:WSC domain-containing protein 2-like n=1 Tax=Haliotis rufescens TaxID=6454 RepID=UPI00201F0B8A|nr:WSC domain-containing protein 2-like [Haliotis rufescens]